MSVSDGKIRFDTEINNSKLKKNLGQMQKMLDEFSNTGGQSFEKVDNAAESTAKTMDEVAQSVQKLQSGKIEKLQKQWDNLNAQIEVQQKLMDALGEKYERVSNLKGPDSEEALKLQKNLLKAEEALDKMIEKSDKYSAEMQKMDEAAAQASTSLNKAGTQASSAAGDIEKVGSAANSADGNLDSLASSAGEAGQALEEISGEASGATSGLEDVSGVMDGLSGSGQSAGSAMNLLSRGLQLLPDVGGSASNVITNLAGSFGGASASGAAMAGVIGGVAVGAMAALGAAIDSLFEKTEEMREGFSTLQVNADAMGVSMETVRAGMEEFVVISEDFNANTEAMANLLAAGFEDSNMAAIVERLSDAVLKFPDTLKIESLADSLQETIATKEAVGQFAELLERLGVDVDKFNEGLKRAAERGKEQEYVLKQLSQTELPGLTAAYKENNRAMVEAKQSEYELQQAMSNLAKEIEPLKFGWDTFWNNAKKSCVDAVTNMIKHVKDLIQWLKELFNQQEKNNNQNPNSSMRGFDSGMIPVRFSIKPQSAETLAFAKGEQVFAAPFAQKAIGLLSQNNRLAGTDRMGNFSESALEQYIPQLIDGLKRMVSGTTMNVTNNVSISLSIDGMEGLLEILEGLQDYPLSVQKGWAGF